MRGFVSPVLVQLAKEGGLFLCLDLEKLGMMR